MNDLIDLVGHVVDEMDVASCRIEIGALLVSLGIPVDETPRLRDTNLIAMRKLLKAVIKLGAKYEHLRNS